MINPHLNHNGWDRNTQTYHCGVCEVALETRGKVLKDHYALSWKHFRNKFFPAILATNSTGHTLEGVIAVPARTLLTHISVHTGLRFCLEHLNLGEAECANCGDSVDRADEHSTCESLEKLTSGHNQNYREIIFHGKCLPPEFIEIHKYKYE